MFTVSCCFLILSSRHSPCLLVLRRHSLFCAIKMFLQIVGTYTQVHTALLSTTATLALYCSENLTPHHQTVYFHISESFSPHKTTGRSEHFDHYVLYLQDNGKVIPSWVIPAFWRSLVCGLVLLFIARLAKPCVHSCGTWTVFGKYTHLTEAHLEFTELNWGQS
jgi:hypothetical protein